jgi:hypothetical protein
MKRRLLLGGERLNHQPFSVSAIHAYKSHRSIEGRKCFTSAETAHHWHIRRSRNGPSDSFCRLMIVCPVENAEGRQTHTKPLKSFFHRSGQHGIACGINPPAL